MPNRYSSDIVVTATLRADGTGNVTVKMGNPENVVEALASIIATAKRIQSHDDDGVRFNEDRYHTYS